MTEDNNAQSPDAIEKEKQTKRVKQKRKDLEEEGRIKRISVSFLEIGDKLLEQVTFEGVNMFAIWNEATQEIVYVSELETGDKIYVPLTGEEIDKGFVFLPTKAEEYGSTTELEEEIKRFVRKWLDISEEHLQYIVWSTMKSWVYDRFTTVNYLRAIGDTGQGKSRYLKTIGVIHYKAIATSGATTSAPLFRIIDKWKGTMLIDEFDLKTSDESSDIIKIVNLGFEKNNGIMRCDQNDAKIVHFFDPFCPKVITSRKSFDDKATESRCITITMEGTERKDIPVELNDSFYTEAQTIRNKLLMWRFRCYHHIDLNFANTIDLGDIEPRLKQINQGFVALFGKDTAKLESFKRFLQERQAQIIQERKQSMEGTIVEAICNLFFHKNLIEISPTDIIENAELKDKEGNYWNGKSIAKYLKELGLGERITKTIAGKSKNCIKFDKGKLGKLAKRYGVDIEKQTDVPPW